MSTQNLASALDMKSFAYGLFGIAGVFLLIIVYILITGSAHIKSEQEKLASYTVPVTYEKQSKIEAIKSEPQHHEPIAIPEPSEDMPEIKFLEHKDGPLSPSPDPNIIEETDAGFLPVISSIGQTPFTTYKKPFYDDIKSPVIALAVSDYGLSQKLSSALLRALPSEVTLILNPYAPDAEDWQKRARQNGHELWLQLPFENIKYPSHDYGPKTLLSKASLTYNQERLFQTLSAATGYAGLAVETDGVFLDSRSMLQTILRSIFERGLGFFELNPNGPLFIESFALNNTTPYIRNQTQITGSEKQVREQLQALEKQAKEKSFSVAYILPQPLLVPVIQEWIKSLEEKNIRLVPLSYISVTQNQHPKPLDTQEVPEVKVVPVKKEEHSTHH